MRLGTRTLFPFSEPHNGPAGAERGNGAPASDGAGDPRGRTGSQKEYFTTSCTIRASPIVLVIVPNAVL